MYGRALERWNNSCCLSWVSLNACTEAQVNWTPIWYSFINETTALNVKREQISELSEDKSIHKRGIHINKKCKRISSIKHRIRQEWQDRRTMPKPDSTIYNRIRLKISVLNYSFGMLFLFPLAFFVRPSLWSVWFLGPKFRYDFDQKHWIRPR